MIGGVLHIPKGLKQEIIAAYFAGSLKIICNNDKLLVGIISKAATDALREHLKKEDIVFKCVENCGITYPKNLTEKFRLIANIRLYER